MNNSQQITQNRTTLTIVLAVLVIALGLLWTGNDPLSDRVVTLRMFLIFISGFVAFATPFLLFPDKYAATIQLGNLHGPDLIRHITQKTKRVFLLSGLLVVILCLGNPLYDTGDLLMQIIYLSYGIIMIVGLQLLSTSRYLRSGKSSQFWKESEKGRDLRKQLADYMKYPMDPGTIPSLINTILITSAGMIAVAVGALFSGIFGPVFELLPAFLLFIGGIYSFRRTAAATEMHYLCTNAFFREFFGTTIAGSEQKEAVKTEQLWWVPSGIKTNVWALLVQLDRKFPAGRVIIAGHVLVWLLSYQRPGGDMMLTTWILFSVMHHGLIFLSASEEFTPVWWQRWMAGGLNWLMSRFWMQFRWVLLLLVSVWLNGFIFGHTGNAEVVMMAGVYILTGFLFSLTISIYQKQSKYS